MRLVLRVDVAPKRILRLVKDDREMGRLEPPRPVADELQHFGGEQPHRAGGQAVGPIIVLLILPDRLEIGSEDERRAIDEKHMVAGTDGTVGLGHVGSLADARSEGYRREERGSARTPDRGYVREFAAGSILRRDSFAVS